MEINLKVKKQFEVECDYEQKVVACFLQTTKDYFDGDKIISSTNHRDVISFEELKKSILSM